MLGKTFCFNGFFRNFALPLFTLLFSCPAGAQDISIIPQPAYLIRGKGDFIISKNTSLVITDKKDGKAAGFFKSYLKKFYGLDLPIRRHEVKNSIQLSTRPDGTGKDAYTFRSDPNIIAITGDTYAGTFYGMQTLIQLLPAQKLSSLTIPAVIINDTPRFAYRGMLLDVSRYFFPVEFIKKYIDFMALHKMNYFHWHLTDDPGWRIQIKRYPKLTETGAWRKKKNIFQYKDSTIDDKRYGGYYTQKQIREIVKYARDRYITIIPEIEMPAHCLSALAAYPELGCTGGPYQTPVKWYPYKDVYCAGNEHTFKFLENVLDEVMQLFPSPYIHIGGDECPKDRWKLCPKCQERIKDEHLDGVNGLQSYFIKRIEKYLNSKGRTLIGWDEILEGGLAQNAVVMSWHGETGGIAAAKEKHRVIMAPTAYCYFDYPQTGKTNNMPDWMQVTTVEKVYSFEPVPKELDNEEAKYVLGAQGNVWTEFISDPKKVEYMIFPRMSALSEVLWSPDDKRNFDDFKRRMMKQFKRYDLWGVSYCKALLHP